MKVFILISVVIAVALADDNCTSTTCPISGNCRCWDAPNPLEPITDYPQLISLTFDEAVTARLVDKVWRPLLFDRTNPDQEPIGGTFFVPHEFTDYVKVNELYRYGFEIAVHSISENNLQSYWRNANVTTLEQEFKGQKIILNKFANIPEDDIKGARTPQLQLAGDNTFEAYVNAGLEYDSSWPTVPIYPLFPYTLDYKSDQNCHLGAKCPKSPFNGFWIAPINDLRGDEHECNTLASCGINGTAEEISEWLLGEVNHIRNTTRVPLTLLVNSYWFDFTENSFEAMDLFFKKAAEIKDIFFVSQSQVIDFIKNPVKLANYKTPKVQNKARCQAEECKYPDRDRTMKSCTPCPDVYPWLGNPEGKKD